MDYILKIEEKLKLETSINAIELLIDRLILLNQNIVIREIWQRWEKGEGVNGGIIGTYKSEEYRLFKESINPLANGNVDLTLTGALAENLTIKKENGNYKIFSTDEKYQKIGKKYGFDQFGLSEYEMIEYLSEIYSFSVETILTQVYV